MTQLTLRQLQLFLAVIDAGSFSLAAARAHISQPALSEQIAQMEHLLRTKLFERSKSGAAPTPLGQEIAIRARAVLADVRELEEAVSAARGNLGGLMRLGVLPTVGPYLLPSIIPDLHKTYPALRLHVRESRTVELEAGLRSGVFDMVLSTPPEDSSFRVEPLFEEPLLLGMSVDNPLAKKATLRTEDLRGQKMLTLESGHFLAARTRQIARAAHVELLTDFEGTSLDSLRQMVGLGMGLSLFPGIYVLAEILNDEALVVRRIQNEDATRLMALVWRKSSPRTDAFMVLADVIRKKGEAMLSQLAKARSISGTKMGARPPAAKPPPAKPPPAKRARAGKKR